MPRHRRNWNLETLESRQLLSVTPSVGGVPAPEWFAAAPAPVEISSLATAALPSLTTLNWRGESVEARRGEWLVQFNDQSVSQMQSALDASRFIADAPFDVRVSQGIGLPGMVLVKSSGSVENTFDWLSGLGNVEFFEPNFTRQLYIEEPNDPGYEFDYALDNQGFFPNSLADADMDALEAWDITTGDRDTIVAVMDTGVNYLHEDLAANMWVNPGEIPGNERDDDGNGFIDDIHGYDFGERDADPMDEEGHGTAVAGTIGAVGNNGVGTVGVNWTTQIMALKIAAADGSLDSAAIIEAVNYATMMRLRGTNVRVSNHSYGGGPPSEADRTSIEAHRDANILYVAAAGNGGIDGIGDSNDRAPDYPASYPYDNIIAVAATDAADNIASFSNYGINNVDLGAPGVEIMTTMVEGGYGYIDGTSFSSPYTAGVAALVGAHAPTATYSEIRQAILEGVDRIPSMNGKVFTGGRLNARGALEAIERIKPPVALVSGNGVAISDGDLTPQLADNTDFGSVSAANGRKVNTFVLANQGGVPLELSGILGVQISGANAADFRLTAIPADVVPGATTTEFSLTFDPAAPGVRTALVTIEFLSGATYEYAVRGTGLAPPPPWQNPRDKYDVNNDLKVSGLDVLLIVNELNRSGPHPLPTPSPGNSPPPYYDVSGDGSVSAVDIVQIVNFINSRPPGSTATNSIAATDRVLETVTVDRSQDVLFTPVSDLALGELANGLTKRNSRRS